MSIVSEKKLGFGTMRLPLTDPENPASIDHKQLQRMVDRYMERGFCYYVLPALFHEPRQGFRLSQVRAVRAELSAAHLDP